MAAASINLLKMENKGRGVERDRDRDKVSIATLFRRRNQRGTKQKE